MANFIVFKENFVKLIYALHLSIILGYKLSINLKEWGYLVLVLLEFLELDKIYLIDIDFSICDHPQIIFQNWLRANDLCIMGSKSPKIIWENMWQIGLFWLRVLSWLIF